MVTAVRGDVAVRKRAVEDLGIGSHACFPEAAVRIAENGCAESKNP